MTQLPFDFLKITECLLDKSTRTTHFAGYEAKLQMYRLYTSKEFTREIRKQQHHTSCITQKEDVYNLYHENYKMLLRNYRTLINILCSWIERLHNVKISILHKLSYRFSEIKVLMRLSCINQQILVYMEMHQTEDKQDNLEEKIGRLNYSISCLALKVIVIKKVQY